jgi:hypothetical protein
MIALPDCREVWGIGEVGRRMGVGCNGTHFRPSTHKRHFSLSFTSVEQCDMRPCLIKNF